MLRPPGRELGVALLDALVAKQLVGVEAGQVQIRQQAAGLLDDLGIDEAAFRRDRRRPLARLCLDWSARRHHLAGALGAAFTSRFLELHWLQRSDGTRALSVTRDGWDGLDRHFGIRS